MVGGLSLDSVCSFEVIEITRGLKPRPGHVSPGWGFGFYDSV